MLHKPRVDGHVHQATNITCRQRQPPLTKESNARPHLVFSDPPPGPYSIPPCGVRPFTKGERALPLIPGRGSNRMGETAPLLHLCPKSLCDTNKRPGGTTTTTIFDSYHIDTQHAITCASPSPRSRSPMPKISLRNEPAILCQSDPCTHPCKFSFFFCSSHRHEVYTPVPLLQAQPKTPKLYVRHNLH